MKKISKKLIKHFIKSQRRKQKKSLRAANRKKHTAIRKKIHKIQHRQYYETLRVRNELKRLVYRERRFSGDPVSIKIDKEFGIEEQNSVQYFLDNAASFIDFNSTNLEFDLSLCDRIWPSGIVLLCSLKQWVELTSRRGATPNIRSTPSNNIKVNSYLGHCGFYEYVGRQKDTPEDYYSDSEIVKIERETQRSKMERREQAIEKLLRDFSGLTPTELEWFNNVILTEIFNNVTEHGVSKYDNGWWLLAQYHKTHKIISVCVADNGIGIRNSLMTGPQRLDIAKKVEDLAENDGEFIKLALEENVSGALAAPLKSGYLKKYAQGARKGNGLARIRKTSAQLGIPFSVLSHNGFLFVSSDGTISQYGAKSNRIFAGTLYHFPIRTKN
jgi:anti-sigma regulatory factor (Ser/Thr protein kinase)